MQGPRAKHDERIKLNLSSFYSNVSINEDGSYRGFVC